MEKLIIEQLKQGNEDAFKYIYKQHYVLLCRFANQMLADAALAEEIVDDAIFYLWEHRSDIEIEYSIRAYLMRAVRNAEIHIAVLVKVFCIGTGQYQLSGRGIKVVHFDAVSGGHVEPRHSDADRICGSLT